MEKTKRQLRSHRQPPSPQSRSSTCDGNFRGRALLSAPLHRIWNIYRNDRGGHGISFAQLIFLYELRSLEMPGAFHAMDKFNRSEPRFTCNFHIELQLILLVDLGAQRNHMQVRGHYSLEIFEDSCPRK